MLKSLYIQNYALISHLEIDFDSGLSIISGETGAGKSILLGALSLIIGQRVDTNVLLDKTRKCVVEVTFETARPDLQQFFDTNDIDFEENTTVRREINNNGKSRAFINDTPVKLPTLRDLGLKLVDIHSQHQNLLLGNNLFQLKVVDDFVQHDELTEKYRATFEDYRKLNTAYNELVDLAGKSKSDLDYFQFQFEQLEKAGLKEDEQEFLEKELEILNHAEEIKSGLTHAAYILSEDENSLLLKLKEIHNLIRKIMPFFPAAAELEKRLESSNIELKDITGEIENSANSVEHNPDRASEIGERLDMIYSLQQKHRVASIHELIKIKEELQNKLDEIISYDGQLERISTELEKKKEKLHEYASKISENRQKIIPLIEKKVISLLRQLGIPNGNFTVVKTDTGEFTSTGTDTIRFLFSANKKTKLQDIADVASGGELSRLMLSLKSLITRSVSLPTVIFDEIDAGVSGDIADKTGNIMTEMARHMQVINITHLPQIASKGKNHYLVYKEDKEDSTHTYIKRLNREERIVEIAKLLSGEELTDAAMVNARELLKY